MVRLRRKMPGAATWAGAESVVVTLLGILSLLLAVRIIGPKAYGEAMLAVTLISLVEVAFGGGMMEALVRHKSADTRTLDTALWTRLGLAALATVACLACQPLVEWSFGPEVARLFLVAILALPFNALSEMPSAVLIRKFRMRQLAVTSIVSRSVMLVCTVALAMLGFGAWSVVVGGLAGSATQAAGLWLRLPRRMPRLRYHSATARQMLAFGSAVAAETLLSSIAARAFISLFGYFHGPEAVGYLGLGLKLVGDTAAILGAVGWKIAFPLLSAVNRSGQQVTDAFVDAGRVLSYLTLPLFAGTAVTASTLIPVVFGPEWLPAVPVTQALAILWVVRGTRILTPSLIKAVGRPGALIGLALLDAILSIAVCIAGRDLDIGASTALWCARYALVLPIEVWIVWKIGRVSPQEQVLPSLKAALAAFVMAGLVVAVQFGRPASWDVLAASVMTGVVSYALIISAIDPTFRELARLLLKTVSARLATGRA